MKVFQFKRERSLDAVIEASFKLLRIHFKPMFSILWKYNAVYIVGFLASYFMFYYNFANVIQSISNRSFSRSVNFGNNFSDPKFIIIGLIMIISGIILFPRFYTTIMGYFRVYMENDGVVVPEKVKVYIDSKSWGLVGLTVLLAIIGFLGGLLSFLFMGLLGILGLFVFIIVFIPLFIYLSTTTTIMYPIYVYEDVSVTEAMSLAFKYIKQKWWYVFFTMFLMAIIVWILGLVVDLPIYLLSSVKGLFGQNEIENAIKGNQGFFLSFLELISLAVRYILETLTLISTVLIYFTLKEYHTQEGILGDIDKIGSDKNEL